MYEALFDRDPVYSNDEGFDSDSFKRRDDGYSTYELADSLINSPEFISTYGSNRQ